MISPTLKCQAIVKERKAKGLEVYNLGLGANPIGPPNCNFNKESRTFFNSLTQPYGSCAGMLYFQSTLKKFFKRPESDQVLVGSGLKEMIFANFV